MALSKKQIVAEIYRRHQEAENVWAGKLDDESFGRMSELVLLTGWIEEEEDEDKPIKLKPPKK